MNAGIEARKWAEKIQASYKVKAGRPLPSDRNGIISMSEALVFPAKPAHSPENFQRLDISSVDTGSGISRKVYHSQEALPAYEAMTVSMPVSNELKVRRNARQVTNKKIDNIQPEKTEINPEVVADRVYRLMQKDLLFRK
jgi:hypothetical protein